MQTSEFISSNLSHKTAQDIHKDLDRKDVITLTPTNVTIFCVLEIIHDFFTSSRHLRISPEKETFL